MHAHPALCLALGAMGVGMVAMLAGQGPARGGGKTDQWEYALLVIDEKTATLRTGNRMTWIEVTPPVAGDPATFRNGDVYFKEQFNPLVTALNQIGAMGWELPPVSEIKAGQTMIVRRAR
ncbi:MAG: hypothetical protein K2X32_10905 [Phycisphaerales bacterium]|nr:hypothetical protein [Phycisphaerales bacterium]